MHWIFPTLIVHFVLFILCIWLLWTNTHIVMLLSMWDFRQLKKQHTIARANSRKSEEKTLLNLLVYVTNSCEQYVHMATNFQFIVRIRDNDKNVKWMQSNGRSDDTKKKPSETRIFWFKTECDERAETGEKENNSRCNWRKFEWKIVDIDFGQWTKTTSRNGSTHNHAKSLAHTQSPTPLNNGVVNSKVDSVICAAQYVIIFLLFHRLNVSMRICLYTLLSIDVIWSECQWSFSSEGKIIISNEPNTWLNARASLFTQWTNVQQFVNWIIFVQENIFA